MARRFFTLLFLFVFLPALAHEAHAGALRIESGSGKEIIELCLNRQAKYKVFTLDSPPRLVLDVPYDAALQGETFPTRHKAVIVKGMRIGRFETNTTRLVFDLISKPSTTRTRAVTKKGKTCINIEISATKEASKPKEKEKSEAAAKPAPPQKPLVVIDAGHGGQDPGAKGPDGVYEKVVVLQYAKELRRELLASGRYRVLLTREDDRFILLRERFEIARKAGASLFISLHADSAPGRSEARGLSVYTLSERSSDAETEALAARENKADSVYGMDLSDQSKDVADILVSLAQRDTMNRSANFAQALVSELKKANARLLPNTHRFAGFAVLKAPDIPSVLIEIGFLSHPKEEKNLISRAYREKLVKGIARGVDAYFRDSEKPRAKK